MAANPLAPELPSAAQGVDPDSRPLAPPRARRAFWLVLAVVVGLGFALRVSRPALVSPLVAHDDVRQHVFWVPRLHDPALFAGDWIADYYESQAPAAYRAVYWLVTLAVDAVTASKLLPLALTVVLAVAAFALGLALWRRVDAAALGTVLLLWSVWQYDDLASATPRAYALPLLTLQLAALAAGRWRLALLVLPIQAIFYPLGCPLAVVTLGLWALWRAWDGVSRSALTPQPPPLRGANIGFHERRGPSATRPPRVADVPTVGEGEYGSPSPTAVGIQGPHGGMGGRGGRGARVSRVVRRALPDLISLGAVTAVALVLVSLGQIDAGRFGPTVSAAEARTMPEFQPGGRTSYFVPDWYGFWLRSSRSGFALGPTDPLLDDLPVMVIPFTLAAIFGGWLLAGRLGWVEPPSVPRSGMLLVVLLVASLLLFFAAHLLLFTLYLPARYVQFSLPLVWALAGSLGWVLMGERLLTRLGAWTGQPADATPFSWAGLTGGELCALVGVAILAVHAPPPGDFYVAGRYPAIYAYLRQSPPDTLVGALPADSNILPLFGQRAILTSFEHALPYQPGYYLPLRERTEAFRAAYYAPTLAPLAAVLDEYGVDVVIADAEILERRRRADRGHPPALERILDQCGVLRERDLVVLPAACIQAAALRP